MPMAALVILFPLVFLLALTSFPFSCLATSSINTSHSFPAYFVFGDSLVDVGNNNYILTSARGNLRPFGVDFPSGPTGRFCNGKIVPDFVCDLISLPYPPPYLAPTTRGKALLQGVSYASGGAGIIRSSGAVFVGRVDFDTQIQWFANTIQELQQLLGVSAAQDLVAKSLYSTTFGSNDYLDNYFLRGTPVSLQYTLPQFQQLLLDKFSSQLKQLYTLGVRKIAVSSIGPIGCIPYQLARLSVNGECVATLNNAALSFNQALNVLLQQLNSELPGAQFIYVDTYTFVLAYRSNPSKYGFTEGSKACCGLGKYNGQVVCLPVLKPCPDRAHYVFWDAFHPSQATNLLLANSLYSSLSSRILGH